MTITIQKYIGSISQGYYYMEEGPESRHALLNYPLETLFSNAQDNFLHDAQTIRMINDVLITSVDEYVERVMNEFALETSQWDEQLQQDYKEMVEVLSGKKEGRAFDLTNERHLIHVVSSFVIRLYLLQLELYEY